PAITALTAIAAGRATASAHVPHQQRRTVTEPCAHRCTHAGWPVGRGPPGRGSGTTERRKIAKNLEYACCCHLSQRCSQWLLGAAGCRGCRTSGQPSASVNGRRSQGCPRTRGCLLSPLLHGAVPVGICGRAQPRTPTNVPGRRGWSARSISSRGLPAHVAQGGARVPDKTDSRGYGECRC